MTSNKTPGCQSIKVEALCDVMALGWREWYLNSKPWHKTMVYLEDGLGTGTLHITFTCMTS